MASLAAARSANAHVSLLGKTAIVTGGTSGLGHAVASRLAAAGASVTIVGRDALRAETVLAEMRTYSASFHPTPTHAFVQCDTFLLVNVRACVAKLLTTHPTLDHLVLSHGMATIQGFTPSPSEGLDQKLTLHVYSRAAFAKGLLPALSLSPSPRVLSVLSAGVHHPYKNYLADPELSLGSYSTKNAADAAGFYNDIFLDQLARDYRDITFVHAAPGLVSTRWGVEMPAIIRWAVRVLQFCVGRPKEHAAEYLMRGFLNPELRGDGRLVLLDQYGLMTPKVTDLHEAARAPVSAHINAVLAAGRAVAGKK
jgi:NAD(P)-dependent dehydrogenase (short-subunit alcohol dehydrogenase family)